MVYSVPVDILPAAVSLLGVHIDPVTAEAAQDRILSMLSEAGKRHVVTPNNEMLVEASHNAEFRDVLNNAALRLPDSTGLLIAARMSGQEFPSRVPGVDCVEQVCTRLDSGHGVFFLGGREGVGGRASEILKKKNPDLRVAGVYEGSPSQAECDAIIAKINASGAHLLLVAFGAPAQDLWIAETLLRLTTVRVAMGVGGTFDFIAGRIRRAPKLLRVLGLEWLWRLVLQPKRIGRIWNAVVVFPLLVLRWGREAPRAFITL
ncbi:WecB/TagA/CpsF family glycosyltransferase [Candidatus Peregrinibacteria bacterium]|nr:WecB/TagA/CpsF family glycosyltransferase [Candidatus Peregrinibacteria bacterium]